jgi:hypothetical protein
MPFDPAILTLVPEAARAFLKTTNAGELFPHARAPEAALAGLYLHFHFWTEAHEIAQDLHTTEGSYWHAIVHRQEPDESNSAYWFRQVGRHPIFPAVAKAAAALGIDTGSTWDPHAFLRLCEQARELKDPDLERQIVGVQRAEWQLLFDYCAAVE